MKLLIVDDNEDGAEMLGMLLSGMGFETMVAHEGKSALEAFERWGPDAVLLDIEMPGMSGTSVARAIRAMQSTVMLIAISGWYYLGEAEMKAAGFDNWFTKPADIERLVRCLRPEVQMPSLPAFNGFRREPEQG